MERGSGSYNNTAPVCLSSFTFADRDNVPQAQLVYSYSLSLIFLHLLGVMWVQERKVGVWCIICPTTPLRTMCNAGVPPSTFTHRKSWSTRGAGWKCRTVRTIFCPYRVTIPNLVCIYLIHNCINIFDCNEMYYTSLAVSKQLPEVPLNIT